MSSIASRWWFGDVVLLTLCGAVVTAAAILTPSPELVSLFGVALPETCQWRLATGLNCPGCGLTRSFTYMAHLDPVMAFRMNWFGPVFFLFVAAQVPYRALRLARKMQERRQEGTIQS